MTSALQAHIHLVSFYISVLWKLTVTLKIESFIIILEDWFLELCLIRNADPKISLFFKKKKDFSSLVIDP